MTQHEYLQNHIGSLVIQLSALQAQVDQLKATVTALEKQLKDAPKKAK